MRSRYAAPAVVTAVLLGLGLAVVLATRLGRTQEASPSSGPAVLVGAGDIAECENEGDEATAALLDEIPGTVFTTGDNAYQQGTIEQFRECYDPSWGRHKDRTRPAPGNHDHSTTGAAGYFEYFGAAAGEPGKGWYSYDLGAWHVVVLNSECHRVGGCEPGSEQEQWLREDLAANAEQCTAAIWHEPRFSSGRYGASEEMVPFWQALYDSGAEVVLNGHEHLYERFAPQTPQGLLDPERGITQFTVGTGGGNTRGFEELAEHSEVRIGDTWGVLKLTLHASSYDWEFVPTDEQAARDSGSAACN